MTDDMRHSRIEIGGLFRCCLDNDLPSHPQLGETVPCKHCHDGLRYVERDDGERVWQAAWRTLGDGWREREC